MAIPLVFRNLQEIATPVCALARNDVRCLRCGATLNNAFTAPNEITAGGDPAVIFYPRIARFLAILIGPSDIRLIQFRLLPQP